MAEQDINTTTKVSTKPSASLSPGSTPKQDTGPVDLSQATTKPQVETVTVQTKTVVQSNGDRTQHQKVAQSNATTGETKVQVKVTDAGKSYKVMGRNVANQTTQQAKKAGDQALEKKKQAIEVKAESSRRRQDRRAQRIQREVKAKQLQHQQDVAKVEALDNQTQGNLSKIMNKLASLLTSKADVKGSTNTASDVEAGKLASKVTKVGESQSNDRLDSVVRPEEDQDYGDGGGGSGGEGFDASEIGEAELVMSSQGQDATSMDASEIFAQQQAQNLAAQLSSVDLTEETIQFFLDLLAFPEIQKLLQERLALEAAAIMRAVLFQLIERLQEAGIDPGHSRLLSAVNSGEFPVTTNQVSELMNLLSNQVQRVDVQQVLREIDTMDDIEERSVPMYRSKPVGEQIHKEGENNEGDGDDDENKESQEEEKLTEASR